MTAVFGNLALQGGRIRGLLAAVNADEPLRKAEGGGGGGGSGGGLLTTTGVPDDAVGDDGAYAFDPAAVVLYGPKAEGAWPTPGFALADDPQMQVADGYIQYRPTEEADWENLVALADLQGEPGDPGPAIEVQVAGGYIQYRVVGAEEWINLVATDDLKGAPGESAYQAAVDGGFEGTEAEWIASLKGIPGDPGPAGGPTVTASVSGNLTLSAATHKGKLLLHSGGVITCPETVAAGFTVDDIVEVRQQTATAVSFATSGAATLDFNDTLYAATINRTKDIVALKVIDVDTWAIFGPLVDA